MADIIQIRRDSAADWTSVDPTLADGEWGYEQDTGKLKLGDGTTAWTSLPYLLGDVDAIHDNIAGEINAIASKTPVVNADVLVIEDSAAAYVKKKILASEFSLASHTHTYYDAAAIHDNESAEISVLTEKEDLINDDMLLIEDSEATNAKKMARLEKVWEMAPAKGGADSDAVHVDVANEIDKLTGVTFDGDDVMILEDKDDSLNKKKIALSQFSVHDHTHTYYDAAAIHDNEANELSALTQKTPPIGADVLVMEDSAAAYVKKKVLVSEFSLAGHSHTYYDANALHDNEAAEIDKLTDVTVATGDILVIEDQSDSWNKKKIDVDDFAFAGHSHSGGVDTTAIHDNEANEFTALTNKATPASADVLIIEDSAASYVKKKLLISALPGGGAGSDTTALHDNEANEISAITEKTTPANDDILVIEDSAASYVKKKLKISNLPGGSGLTQAQVLARGLGA